MFFMLKLNSLRSQTKVNPPQQQGQYPSLLVDINNNNNNNVYLPEINDNDEPSFRKPTDIQAMMDERKHSSFIPPASNESHLVNTNNNRFYEDFK